LYFSTGFVRVSTLFGARPPICDIPVQGLIELIGYSYQQVATSFSEGDLQRILRLSVLGLKQFRDG